MQKNLHEFLKNLPHNRFDIVSKDIFGTFTEDLLRKLTNIPGLKFIEQLETELLTVEIQGVSRVEWVEQCNRMTLARPLTPDLQNNLLIWQWILSGLIVDPAEIRHLLEGPMLKSSTYRYILQQGIEQGIEQGARESTIEGILEALEIQFDEIGVQTLKPMLESIEELQHLKDLRRAVLQVNSLDEFKTLLASNGS